ncbi:NADH-quinone oxidoreductase subunit N [Phnomibacter ginsenosidimutans]|uniref:NADH-quinone oxidoreductase subunit N n=1 Tax=Phnomibacter ginsenosidimutans TaxID=2676868 RepID=A0A6I6H4H1_9BACT|nr:NADH-quinone oxidoreductase subunit N [Phnomibacter ginsenosidimutans]QGW29321.1 NADH-quinone oxidoreductase subunit NuoN [Phnomibacter ginsenosidimutans]
MVQDFFLLMRSELMLILIIFGLLFLKLGNARLKNETVMNMVNAVLIATLAMGFLVKDTGMIFGNMFHTTDLIRLEKNILTLGTLIISLQSYQWLKAHKHAMEFYLLLISTLLGMFFMLSSANLLMFYLGLELSTIPLAAMVNFDLHKKQSSEAAFKMIVSSAFSSALLLFGISWMYGIVGSVSYSAIAAAVTGSPLEIFAFVMILAGFGFKISAVPFHLWTADVYEGAPIPVTSYLSVISKGAILFVFITVLYSVFRSMGDTWYYMLYILSVATMLIGNLFAMRQQNMKRFLAFSSIAQVGFILLGISGQSVASSTSLIFFVLIYIFSNLAAFGVVSLVSSAYDKEKVDDYKGFYQTNPLLAWTLAIALFSLAGIPPTAGFFGKFFLILAGAAKGNWLLITIAALNMIISLYYYQRVVKAMFMDHNAAPLEKINTPLSPKIALIICIAGILITGLYSGAYEYIYQLVS